MDRATRSVSQGQMDNSALPDKNQCRKQYSSSLPRIEMNSNQLTTITTSEKKLTKVNVKREAYKRDRRNRNDTGIEVEENETCLENILQKSPSSSAFSASQLLTELTLFENEPLPFMKASSFGSRRRDGYGCESNDFSDVMDFFDNGISDFSDNIKRWVGGSQPFENEMPTNFGHHHQTNFKSTAKNIPATETLSATVPLSIPSLETGADDKSTCHDPLFPPHDSQVAIDEMAGSIYQKGQGSNKSSGSGGFSSSSSNGGGRKRQYKIISMNETRVKDVDEEKSKADGNQALGCVLSALYGKLLVVMGIAFPMSEVISTYIPPSFYDGFYLYLYFGSITFMICMYGNVMSQKASRSMRYTMQRIHSMRSHLTSSSQSSARADNINIAPVAVESRDCDNIPCSDVSDESCIDLPVPSTDNQTTKMENFGIHSAADLHEDYHKYQRIHFGSFYLRMGAVGIISLSKHKVPEFAKLAEPRIFVVIYVSAFGIGSMIYSGLEFGQYFELEPDTKCHNFMIALTPAVRMIFTFMQMYFIFMNSKMAVSKIRLGAQFGLMHMIGTNLCVWLNVLVQETRHEILNFYNPDNYSINEMTSVESDLHNSSLQYDMSTFPMQVENTTEHIFSFENDILGPELNESVLHRFKRGLRGPHSLYECRRVDIMGSLIQNVSPFLFPCTIEYSLICAAILYVMWKSKVKCDAVTNTNQIGHQFNHGSQSLYSAKRSPHHYSVDCARANKGLFLGIFILVMTIISLILYFVLITRPEYQQLATLEVNVTELVLYTTTTIAVLIGMCQIRELRFIISRNLELDNTLLIIAQTGSFVYNIFTVIGGHFTQQKNSVLVMMTALTSLIQLLVQTLFILDASKRCAVTSDQARRKPGREVVTFLLVTNLAMWAINTLEKSRADSDQVQLKFYGVWAWTILIHLSMPLAIFYRFHSSVCLCEIWKRSYKLKPMYR